MKPVVKLTLHPADGYAVKAWAAGEATPEQQKRAFDVLQALCGVRDEPFDTINARLTDYRLGRQSVWRDIVGIVNSKVQSKRRQRLVPLLQQQQESES